MKSKFAAAQFYQYAYQILLMSLLLFYFSFFLSLLTQYRDFSKQGLVKTIMKVEELLKFMMREYTDGSYHVGCGIKMDLLEGISLYIITT